MNHRIFRQLSTCATAAAMWFLMGCGASEDDVRHPPEADISETGRPGLVVTDGTGKRFRIESREGSPLRQPAPGTDALFDLESRETFLGSRTPGGRIAATFYDTQIVLYSMLNVPIFCATDTVCERRLASPFPDFYRPTWREYFNAIARSTGSHWDFTADWKDAFVLEVMTAEGTKTMSEQRDGFLFEEPAIPLPFTVTVAKGWRSDPHGDYVSYIPPVAKVGMDVYMGGEYSSEDPGLFDQVREFWAMLFAPKFKADITPKEMTLVQVAGVDALFWEYHHPEADKAFRWRQWSFVKEGHAFVIVSIIDDVHEAVLWPDISSMVASFDVTPS